MTQLLAILGDSRCFDTYFVNPHYESPYGYQATFPHLLRKRLMLSSHGHLDAVHIPDHFRGGAVENNIIRLALCDPDLVILCDGIWDTILKKDHFLEYVAREIRSHDPRNPTPLTLSFSTRSVADLYLSDKLSISPTLYAARIAQIASYFVRRRRIVAWMNLCVPERGHMSGLHFAGEYRPPPEWQECLIAVNRRVNDALTMLGAEIIDVDGMMRERGGAKRALIDQWHYSAEFHEHLSKAIESWALARTATGTLGSDHASRQVMLPGPPKDLSIVVIGDEPFLCAAESEGDALKVETTIALDKIQQADWHAFHSRLVVLAVPPGCRDATAVDLLQRLSSDWSVLYPDEIAALHNPIGPENTRPTG